MIPWIQIYSNLPQHPKTSKLADELGLNSAALNPNVLAVGMLVSLWTWAIQNALEGDLSGCSPRAIAEACLWKKRPEVLISALQKSGYLDKDMKLHDWDDYTAMFQDLQDDAKAKHRERQKRYRERKKASHVTSHCDDCVTSHGDACDAIPNQTKPDLTGYDDLPTVDHHTLSGGGGDAQAQARAEVSQFCLGRDLDPDAYFGMTGKIREEVRAFTDAIFSKFSQRQPTDVDEGQVFQTICESRYDGQAHHVSISKDRKELLMYACETAASAGKAGDWKYIGGILARLRQRGICTLQEAEDYDMSRDNDRR